MRAATFGLDRFRIFVFPLGVYYRKLCFFIEIEIWDQPRLGSVKHLRVSTQEMQGVTIKGYGLISRLVELEYYWMFDGGISSLNTYAPIHPPFQHDIARHMADFRLPGPPISWGKTVFKKDLPVLISPKNTFIFPEPNAGSGCLTERDSEAWRRSWPVGRPITYSQGCTIMGNRRLQ